MRIQRTFRAETAHKVPGAYTCRCHHLHGHSYRFEVEAQAKVGDAADMVIDFKLLEVCGIKDFIDGFDHAVVIKNDDDLVPLIDRGIQTGTCWCLADRRDDRQSVLCRLL